MRVALAHLIFRFRSAPFAGGLGLAILLGAASARAQPADEGDAVVWREDWPRFSVAEYVATGTLWTANAVGMFALEQRTGKWSSAILFDDAARDGIRVESRSSRDSVVAVGDVVYFGLLAYPIVIDSALTAWAIHQSPDVAGQLFLMDAQAMGMSGFVSVYSQKLVGRERPIVEECASDPDYDMDCADDVAKNQSFISGHTTMAYTGAGLICAHHMNLPLYGGGFPDAVACGLGLAGATFVGASRLIADRHYASDVLAGAIVGLSSGFLVPAWWHYGLFESGPEPTALRLVVMPSGQAGAVGVSVAGTH